jgi:L,D-transpeptidase catalytic domain
MLHRRALLGLALAGGVSLVGFQRQSLAAAIGKLKYGEYLWYPDVSPQGPVVIIVSIPEQLMHVYRNGIEVGVCTVSTGKTGHATPTGVFTILQKKQEYYSNLYDNAPMPYMQRLTWSGIAIHAGKLPGYPASHGCVRIPFSFSKILYDVTNFGSVVIIADQTTAPTDVLQPGILLPPLADAKAKAAAAAAATAKKKTLLTASDPRTQAASILVSGADRKGYFFRGGKLEVTMPVDIDEPARPLGNHLYSFNGIDNAGQLRWTAFGLVTPTADSKTQVTRETDDTLSRLHVADRDLMLRIAATVQIGASLVVTDFAASPETRTGPDFAVVKSDEKPTRTLPKKPVVNKPAAKPPAKPVVKAAPKPVTKTLAPSPNVHSRSAFDG